MSRPARRAPRSPRSPNWNARPSTSTPTGSPRWRCGTPAPPGTTPSRWSTRWCRFSRYAVPQPLLVDIVDTMARYGRLQLVKSPVHGLILVSLDRAVLEEVLRNKKIAPMLGARIDDDTVIVHPSERGRIKQMLLKIGWPAEDLAGYVDGESASDQPRAGRLASARLPGDGRRLVLGGRLRCGGAAVRCGQDDGRRRGDGQGRRDDADPGHQHRGRAAVEARADRAHVADRGRDRRVLRRDARRSGRSPSPPIR